MNILFLLHGEKSFSRVGKYFGFSILKSLFHARSTQPVRRKITVLPLPGAREAGSGWCPPCLNHRTPDTCVVSRVCTSHRDPSSNGMYWTRLLTSWPVRGSKKKCWNFGVSLPSRFRMRFNITDNFSFENQFDFYTDDLKKYLPKIKLVLKINLTFIPMTWKSICRK